MKATVSKIRRVNKAMSVRLSSNESVASVSSDGTVKASNRDVCRKRKVRSSCKSRER
jgi:hypothetical protein